jgi:hypothetical protein
MVYKNNRGVNFKVDLDKKVIIYENEKGISANFTSKDNINDIFSLSYKEVTKEMLDIYIENGFRYYTEKEIEKEISIIKEKPFKEIPAILEKEVNDFLVVSKILNKPLEINI